MNRTHSIVSITLVSIWIQVLLGACGPSESSSTATTPTTAPAVVSSSGSTELDQEITATLVATARVTSFAVAAATFSQLRNPEWLLFSDDLRLKMGGGGRPLYVIEEQSSTSFTVCGGDGEDCHLLEIRDQTLIVDDSVWTVATASTSVIDGGDGLEADERMSLSSDSGAVTTSVTVGGLPAPAQEVRSDNSQVEWGNGRSLDGDPLAFVVLTMTDTVANFEVFAGEGDPVEVSVEVTCG